MNSVVFFPSKIRAFPIPYNEEQTVVALVICFVTEIIDVLINDKPHASDLLIVNGFPICDIVWHID